MNFKIGQIVKIKKLDEKYLERYVGISYNLYLELMKSEKLYISDIRSHNEDISYQVSGTQIWFLFGSIQKNYI